MQPHLLVLDEVLTYPHAALAALQRAEFKDYVSEAENITYPHICEAIPTFAASDIHLALAAAFGRIHIKQQFARLTIPGALAPNRIHTDVEWGQYAAHLYLSKHWGATSGTSFWQHNSETEILAAQADTNRPDRWTRTMFIPGQFNRMLAHRAELWHCAEPIGGWGTTVQDGRLVITTFFDQVR